MKRGFFSHQLCFRDLLLNKHILYLTADNRVDRADLFRQEVAMTIFCEGILIAVAPDFIIHEADFCQELCRQLSENSLLTVGEAILQNSLYRQYAVVEGAACLLYSITPVNWSTARLSGDIVLRRII